MKTKTENRVNHSIGWIASWANAIEEDQRFDRDYLKDLIETNLNNKIDIYNLKGVIVC